MDKTCNKCGETKPLNRENFVPSRGAKDGYRGQCRVCKRAQDLEFLKDPGRYARVAAAGDRWRPRNQEKILARVRAWRKANPEKMREIARQRYQRDRTAVFGHYGWSCACCGSTENLSIACTDGSSGKRSRLFYARLIRDGFPAGYQTLCLRHAAMVRKTVSGA